MAKGIKPKPPKARKCKCCPEKFIPQNIRHICCSAPCAYKYVKQQSERKKQRESASARMALKRRKNDVRPLKHWINLTQRTFNNWVRLRDGNICISCGSTTAVSYHAGHYRTTAAASQLRFNEDNVHSQCSACNTHHSGNIGPYRINLITKIGLQRVLALESNNTPHRYTREELDGIRAHYRALLRALVKQREAA
ncbi:recombination protein NinG [uncultured Pantoea sp.]|uniref:recombination protein NinG n=1 Tax=uncultured Pantoea sp. TaxID=218084 RepID=UPI00258C00CD|nr:recombination protein NinG [uncultured Pantoea sp.]